jgi:hypothetical protein
MKKFTLIILSALMLLSCGNRNSSDSKAAVDTGKISIETSDSVINVLYFHGTQRCRTCIAVEKITKETLDSLYSGNSSIVYTEVNTDDPAFSEITEKFQISWSSLIISKGEEKIDLTDFAFANALKSPELLKVELEKTLNNIL